MRPTISVKERAKIVSLTDWLNNMIPDKPKAKKPRKPYRGPKKRNIAHINFKRWKIGLPKLGVKECQGNSDGRV